LSASVFRNSQARIDALCMNTLDLLQVIPGVLQPKDESHPDEKHPKTRTCWSSRRVGVCGAADGHDAAGAQSIFFTTPLVRLCYTVPQHIYLTGGNFVRVRVIRLDTHYPRLFLTVPLVVFGTVKLAMCTAVALSLLIVLVVPLAFCRGYAPCRE